MSSLYYCYTFDPLIQPKLACAIIYWQYCLLNLWELSVKEYLESQKDFELKFMNNLEFYNIYDKQETLWPASGK